LPDGLSSFHNHLLVTLFIQTEMQAQSRESGGEPNPVDTTGLCLLSLDGGGVRGLSTLFILKGIMAD
jgi:hypothetical protein